MNIIDGIKSVYTWEGKVNADPEVLLMVKTTAKHLPKLTARVKEKHSYDVPETIAASIIGGSREYMQWVHDSTADT